MPQKEEKILPKFLNLDESFESMGPDDSPFIKNITDEINANPEQGNGSNTPLQEGSNVLSLTPIRSNERVPGVILPAGYNKNIGSFESELTQECYCFEYNDAGNHSICILDGNTGIWTRVIVDPNLQFTDNQENFIAPHKVRLWVVLDAQRNIVEKYLLFTDGNSWQKWINVIAAVKTDGFNSSLFPYWNLAQPHFDRRELLEWAVRPCMINPVVSVIPNTGADVGKINRLIDQGFQFAQVFNNTDGRPSANLSPYSLPLIIKSEDFLNNPDNLSKNALVTLYAGSCMVESIDLYVRKTAKNVAGVASTISWGKWLKYDRIYKYIDPATGDYWLRTNPWSGMNYDPVFNTIQYIFDNSKLADIPVIDTDALQNDIPQTSMALTDLGDSAALSNNRYGYDNLPASTLSNLDAQAIEKEGTSCLIPNRKIRLYAYIGRDGDRLSWESQVGYYNGSDTLIRFGGMQVGPDANIEVSVDQSTFFNLNFADKNALRVYLKGTPYYADGNWYQVNSDNTMVKLAGPLDISNSDVQQFIQNVFLQQGYFVCVFNLQVPAGRYIATLGRHNVPSSGDYRNTSTYIIGIADSRKKSQGTFTNNNHLITYLSGFGGNTSVVSFSKEQEIDCTSGDVDVWGNGQDLFYVYCPFISGGSYRFIEGYLQESQTSPIPVDYFPYTMTQGFNVIGEITDKNGFYFGSYRGPNSNFSDAFFTVRLNCQYPVTFNIQTSGAGNGYRPNPVAYLSDHNSGVVGDCNRVIYSGRITSLDGTVGYSDIAISIKDGETVYTNQDGTFTLVVHNGKQSARISNVYVNAGGNFLLTIANCGFIPVFNYNDGLVACISCQVRNYPVPLNLAVNAQGGTEYSLKENGSYSIGCACADLAGRLGYVNPIVDRTVPSFLQRNDVLPTFFRMILKGALKLNPDLKWFAPYVSGQLNILNYIQWIGDSIVYIDNNGNVVTDAASAVFCSISIQSLYNNNIGRNFSLLASYQFAPEDRLRVLDDGNGNLLDTATYGDPIDLQILGTNYNQAAMTAGIIPNNSTVPIVNNNISNSTTVNTTAAPTITTIQTTQNNTSITLYVRYDSRLNKLINNNGFWIEIYTPSQQSEEIPFNELKWYPVVNGEVAEFVGFDSGISVYNYPDQIDILFWDTYLFSRNITIPNIGDKSFGHPFESPNISDNFGANITSGGRKWVKNTDAKQLIYKSDVIRSNVFTTGGMINGLGIFVSTNRKDFSQNPFGGIMATITQRSIILFICENDWFTTNFDYHYTYPNAQGVMVVNLDQGISTPSQKIGDNFGMSAEDTGSMVIWDRYVSWYDRKSEAFVICNYQAAEDISDITDQEGKKYGIKSYLKKKTQFITNWNLSHEKSNRFDVTCGIDIPRKSIHLTFRPRRKSTNDISSYVNQRRNEQLNYQETVIYSLDKKRWTKFVGYTPESYGTVRGNYTGIEMIAFAAGVPYTHNNVSDSFLTFFGQLTEAVFVANFNKQIEFVKILQSIALDCNSPFLIDLIYSEEGYSYSYLPVNYFVLKENLFYGHLLRNMVSYPPIDPKKIFLSMLHDGKRNFGTYFLCRFVGISGRKYFQLTDIYYSYSYSSPEKK